MTYRGQKTIYLTKQSTSLEYISIYGEDNEYYHCYFKFRGILRLFRYKIDKMVWRKVLEPIATLNEGLNIGKTIGSYILTNQIIEEIKYKDIIKEL